MCQYVSIWDWHIRHFPCHEIFCILQSSLSTLSKFCVTENFAFFRMQNWQCVKIIHSFLKVFSVLAAHATELMHFLQACMVNLGQNNTGVCHDPNEGFDPIWGGILTSKQSHFSAGEFQCCNNAAVFMYFPLQVSHTSPVALVLASNMSFSGNLWKAMQSIGDIIQSVVSICYNPPKRSKRKINKIQFNTLQSGWIRLHLSFWTLSHWFAVEKTREVKKVLTESKSLK